MQLAVLVLFVNKFYLDMSWRKEECKMRNLNFKVIVDGMLIVTLLLSMAYLLIGVDNHEIVGTVFFILFIVHIILNRRWFFSVFKGKYSGMRIFFIGLNFLIFVMMIGLIISGMIFATYTPNFIKTANSIEMARLLHLLTGYWCFVLLSLHLGTNLTPIVNAIKLNDMYKEIIRFAGILLACYGVFAFVRQNIISYLFLQQGFVFFNINQSLSGCLIDYIAIMSFGTMVGYSIKRLFIKINLCKMSKEMKIKSGVD